MTRRHLFVCTNPRSSGKPACGTGGGEEILAEVQHLLIVRAATDPHGATPLVTSCGCLGPCFDGPNAVIYPDAIWYGQLSVADAPGLVEHLVSGVPLAARVVAAPGLPPDDDDLR